MKLSFDLIYEPWIPCLNLQGEFQIRGILPLLEEAHIYQEIHANTPPVTVAILRLLLAILHRNFGPENEHVWIDIWQKGRFDRDILQAYFDEWKDRFDLFHPRYPFFQKKCADASLKPANSLIMHVASGNSATLFNHETEDSIKGLSPAEAAQALITIQAFGLAGICNSKKGWMYTDAPCARGAVLFLSGDTLFETLMLNLQPYDRSGLFSKTGEDRPAWEREDVFSPPRTIPTGYLDFLTWQARKVFLSAENRNREIVVRQAGMIPGLTLDHDFENPMYFYSGTDNKEKKFLRFLDGRALWRESANLLCLPENEQFPLAGLQWIVQLRKQGVLSEQALRLNASGISTEPGKHKIYSYHAEQISFSIALLTNPDFAGRLKQKIEQTEEAHRILSIALMKFGTLILSSEADRQGNRIIDAKYAQSLYQHWNIEKTFWNILEHHFPHFVKQLPKKPVAASTYWDAVVQGAIWQTFGNTVCMSREENLKAVVRTKNYLYNALKKIFKPISWNLPGEKNTSSPFIDALFHLYRGISKTGNLNILQRDACHSGTWDQEMQDWVDQYIPEKERGTWGETVHYLVAELFVSYPEITGKGNIGNHFRAIGYYGSNQEYLIEKRFSLLLSADITDLPTRLRKSFCLFQDRGIGINWQQLFVDLLSWDDPDRHIQYEWANAFWGYGPSLVDLKKLWALSLDYGLQGESNVY